MIGILKEIARIHIVVAVLRTSETIETDNDAEVTDSSSDLRTYPCKLFLQAIVIENVVYAKYINLSADR